MRNDFVIIIWVGDLIIGGIVAARFCKTNLRVSFLSPSFITEDNNNINHLSIHSNTFTQPNCVAMVNQNWLISANIFKLNCVRGEHKPARCRCFATVTLRLTP